MAQKKRKLRLGDARPAKAARLFDFASNPLLFQDQPVLVDPATPHLPSHLYQYYDDGSELPTALTKETNLKRTSAEPPRRRRHRVDPLQDELYLPFHRRMKQHEKSMALADKSRVMFEVDNLRTQMALLRQHDWAKHLPRITVVDKTPEDLAEKRKLTLAEIRKLLQKYHHWDARNEQLVHDIKQYEAHPVSDDDLSELILTIPVAQLQKEREDKRLQQDGYRVRLRLRNGHDIVYGPYQPPKVVPESKS